MSKEEARKELAALSRRASTDDLMMQAADYRIAETIAMTQPKRKPSFGSMTWTQLKIKRET